MIIICYFTENLLEKNLFNFLQEMHFFIELLKDISFIHLHNKTKNNKS